MLGHIIEREIIHLFSSPGVFLIMLLASWLLRQKWDWWKYNGPQGWFAYIVPAMVLSSSFPFEKFMM